MSKMVRRFLLLLVLGTNVQAADLPWAASQQMVVVTTADWDADQGFLQTFERGASGWTPASSRQPITVGRAGSAWGIGLHPASTSGPVKREGDERSPAGVFPIGIAFGYAPSASTKLLYQGMSATDYCIDVTGSASYNKIVDSNVVGKAAIEGSTEPMRRDLHASGDQRYKLGFVIEHNARGTPSAGSCIFAHLWRQPGEATAGCTAMAEPAMQQLLGWLDASRYPVFVLLPESEYARLKEEWRLP